MTQTPENLITRKQAADRAGVSPRTIDRWRRMALLTTYRRLVGPAVVLVDPVELDALQKTVQAVPAQRTAAKV